LKESTAPEKFDCLLLHVPKFGNYYRPFGKFSSMNLSPAGMFSMADLLQREGHGTRIVHLGVELEKDRKFSICDFIREADSRIIGLDLYYHQQSYDVLDVAEKIKKAFPDKLLVIGGFTASFYPEEILRKFSQVDGVIRGDGEVPLLLLMRLMKAGKRDFSPVPNLSWRKDGVIKRNSQTYVATAEDMNRLNYANFSLMKNHEAYRDTMRMNPWSERQGKSKVPRKEPLRTYYLQTGKGCPFSCSWCGGGIEAHRLTSGRDKPVFRSRESVVNTVKEALKYGFGCFHISFDPEPGNPVYYLELFEKFKQEGLNFGCVFESWGLPTKEFIASFAGTFPLDDSAVILTMASGSERARKLNRANYISNQDLFETLSFLEEAAIRTEVYFNLAGGSEAENDAESTSALMLNLRRHFKNITSVRAFTVEIEPGSPLQIEPDKYGAVTNRRNFIDYYAASSWDDSNPYAGLGYHLPAFFKDQSRCDDLKTFEGEMQKLRCRSFCLLQGKDSPFTGRLKCWFKRLFPR
jgi:pyruvate-formate lyase-activating enzyme